MSSSHCLAKRFLLGAGIATLLTTQLVAAQTPAQRPLISRDGGGVKPNIMLTMDDSGSMMFQHMPEENIVLGPNQTVTSPLKYASTRGDLYRPSSETGTVSIRMDPDDNAYLATHFKGTISGDPGQTNNYRQKLMRSADTNTIYYNPEVQYLPWPLAAGGRMAAYPVTAAPRDPMNPAGGGTINLTNIRFIPKDHVWCFWQDHVDECHKESDTANYDPGLYYRLKKDGAGQYLSATGSGNYDQFSINAAAATLFTKYPARSDCTGVSCTRDQERQNYSNWFTYYRTRNLLARGAVAEAFSEAADTFRVGYGRINSGSTSIDGVNTPVIQSGVRDFSASRKSDLFTWLYALPASGGTPLRLAMQSVGDYYSRSDTKGPWTDIPGSVNVINSEKACRRSYHLLMTDGYWNDSVGSDGLLAAGNADNIDGATIHGPGQSFKYVAAKPYRDGSADTLADYAMKYWKKDLRPELDNKVFASLEKPEFWQHMSNFTVGLGVRGTLDPATDLPLLTSGAKSWGSDRIDDLWHAAINSDGEFFSAKDPVEMANSIRLAIAETRQRELREAGTATAATTLQNGNRKYVPLFKTGTWNGDVEAYALDINGQAGALIWGAEAKLPAWASRKIFTWDTGLATPAGVAFDWAAISAANRTALGPVGVTYTSSLVDFLRGDRSREGSGQPFRLRNGVLGDFVNSAPVLVKGVVNLGYSTLPGIGASYASFLVQKAARTAVLFAGSNDGMLHGFKDTLGAVPADDGKEVFAFVPRTVYSNLSKLSDKTYGTGAVSDPLYHQYYVDGPLQETDAFVRAPGASSASWRNYLLGALGSGGRAVYALDVTDPANLGASTIRWEFSSSNDSDLGYVYSPVEAGVLPNGEWVAIFGNGHMSGAGNAVLFVANLETGVTQKLVVDALGANGLSGVAVQRNSAGQITNLFAGDLNGKLWKFDYNAAAASRFEISGGTPIFSATSSAGAAQPITQAPAIFDHPDGGKMLVFGTGVLVTETDASSTATQAVYGVWDKPSDVAFPRPLTRASLSTRTISAVPGNSGSVFYDVTGTVVDFVTQRGWVIDLGIIPGLRVVSRPLRVSKDFALVSTLAPAQSVTSCDQSTGVGITLLLPVASGANPTYRLFDTNGDDVVNNGDRSSVGFLTNSPSGSRVFLPGGGGGGGGMCPAGFTMGAILDQATGTRTCIPDEPGAALKIKDRVWRRIINPPIR